VNRNTLSLVERLLQLGDAETVSECASGHGSRCLARLVLASDQLAAADFGGSELGLAAYLRSIAGRQVRRTDADADPLSLGLAEWDRSAATRGDSNVAGAVQKHSFAEPDARPIGAHASAATARPCPTARLASVASPTEAGSAPQRTVPCSGTITFR
jgi:hypothetical protein